MDIVEESVNLIYIRYLVNDEYYFSVKKHNDDLHYLGILINGVIAKPNYNHIDTDFFIEMSTNVLNYHKLNKIVGGHNDD